MKKIPLEKKFYTMGEAAEAVGVQQHILRNWEKEFQFLKPQKKESGHRLYYKEDVEVAQRIRELLYDEHYTIQGAKKRLWHELRRKEAPPLLSMVNRIKNELKELIHFIESTQEKK